MRRSTVVTRPPSPPLLNASSRSGSAMQAEADSSTARSRSAGASTRSLRCGGGPPRLALGWLAKCGGAYGRRTRRADGVVGSPGSRWRWAGCSPKMEELCGSSTPPSPACHPHCLAAVQALYPQCTSVSAACPVQTSVLPARPPRSRSTCLIRAPLGATPPVLRTSATMAEQRLQEVHTITLPAGKPLATAASAGR